MSETTKYMLDYDGLKVITDNVVKNCVPLTGFDAKINNTIQRVMRSFNVEFIQYATSYENLPAIGVQGILYMVMKRPGDYVVYSFENNKYVQVGASTFKHDFDPDLALDANSTNMVTNAAITTALNSKYTKTGMVATPTADSDELVESAGIKAELDLKANVADFSLLDKYRLRKIFYTEYTNGAYLRVYVRFYNKDLIASNGTISMNNVTLGNLRVLSVDNENAIFNSNISTIPTVWYKPSASGARYNATIRISHPCASQSNSSRNIDRLLSIDKDTYYQFDRVTDGNLWFEITFTTKIPVETLMESTLSINEFLRTGRSVNNTIVHDQVYITTEVSADNVHWNIWRDDQQQYDAVASTDAEITGRGTFTIPVFR